MKLCWSLLVMSVTVLAMTVVATPSGNDENLWDENLHDELLVRVSRGTKERVSAGTVSCRYVKGDWSTCDVKTNTRTRILDLKKGDPKTCEQTKTIEKRCRKDCRYEKGTWGECVDQLMNRIDNLKPDSDRACDKTRRRSKRCKSETNTKKAAKSDRSNKKSGKQ